MVVNRNISPPDPKLLNDPKHWRDKAEEARAKAEIVGDEEAREIMLRVAADYDRLAKKAEQSNLK